MQPSLDVAAIDGTASEVGADENLAIEEFTGDGPQSARASKPSESAVETRKEVAADGEVPPVFVELVLHISDTPFTDQTNEEWRSLVGPTGYRIVRPSSGLRPTLYPLTGQIPPDEVPGFVVGATAVNDIPHDLAVRREFYYDQQGKLTVDLSTPGGSVPLPRSFSWPGPVIVERSGDGELSVTFDGTETELKAGDRVVLYQLDERFDAEALVDRWSEFFSVEGKSELDREELTARLMSVLGIEGHVPDVIYQRLTAQCIHDLELADFDAEHCWQQAIVTAEFGPYSESEEWLDLVLQAIPEHEQARDLLSTVIDRIQRKSIPSRLVGTLKFPDSIPRKEFEELWKRFGFGTATMSSISGPEDGQFSTSVEDGRIEIGIPDGFYNLQVIAPGCAPFEQKVEISGTLKLNIELQP